MIPALTPAPSKKAWLPAPESSFQQDLTTPFLKFFYWLLLQLPLKRLSSRLRLSNTGKKQLFYIVCKPCKLKWVNSNFILIGCKINSNIVIFRVLIYFIFIRKMIMFPDKFFKNLLLKTIFYIPTLRILFKLLLLIILLPARFSDLTLPPIRGKNLKHIFG